MNTTESKPQSDTESMDRSRQLAWRRISVRVLLYIAAILVVVFFIASPVKAASFPSLFDPATMAGDEGYELFGVIPTSSGNPFSSAVTALGDFDGDGHDDYFVVGKDYIPYLVYGSSSSGNISVSDGIRLESVNEMEPAGDFNNDGYDDVIIQRHNDPQYILLAGSGVRLPNPFNAEAPGEQRIVVLFNSLSSVGLYGSASAAGDFNGDGFDDLFIRSIEDTVDYRQSIKIMPGRSLDELPGQFDVSTLLGNLDTTLNYVRAVNPDGSEWIGHENFTAHSGGDVNGDGYDDFLLRMPDARDNAGEIFVVFGGMSGLPQPIERATLNGIRGFATYSLPAENPPYAYQQITGSIAGDLNADGIDDLLIGSSSGVSVVMGHKNSWSPVIDYLNSRGPEGFQASDANVADRFTAFRTGPAGDVDSDGNDDWLFNNRVIFGSAGILDYLDLSGLNGENGFSVHLPFATAVAAGDINGDSIDDLLIGSGTDTYQDTPTDAYVVFGRAPVQAPLSPNDPWAALGEQVVHLHWAPSASPSVTGYSITRDGVVVATTAANTTEYEINHAVGEAVSHYEIRAFDGENKMSAPVTLVIDNNLERYPEIGGDVYSGTLAEIFWSYDNVEYRVIRDNVVVDTRYAGSYLDDAFSLDGHNYYVEVVRQPDEQFTVRSPTLFLANEGEPRPPTVVKGLRIEWYSITTAELFWSAPDFAIIPVLYEVARDGELLGTTQGTSFFDNTLVYYDTFFEPLRYQVHEYQVTAIDANGKRSNPLVLSVNVADAIQARAPAAPVNLSATVYSETAAEVFWEPGSTGVVPDRYELWLSPDRFSRDYTYVGSTNGTSFYFDALSPNQYYIVAVVGASDDDERSNIHLSTVTFATPVTPDAANNFRIEVYGPNMVELFWDRAPEGATGIYWAIVRNDVQIGRSSGSSFIDTTLETGVAYEYRLQAIAGDRVSELSYPITIMTDLDEWLD